ncbi:hypothetical protein CDCA_CDCA09G2699 [Cyanidium caldarium]|uniref:AAA+ ATPase domain-containing protein n=1 Tax=Cyanidium caldarium TaxID=2771 RepID=A0AAV9IX35_CYACA|nr:hypothetical protein CDCA_CDCA09G2699 [Cyanidium caldarium]
MSEETIELLALTDFPGGNLASSTDRPVPSQVLRTSLTWKQALCQSGQQVTPTDQVCVRIHGYEVVARVLGLLPEKLLSGRVTEATQVIYRPSDGWILPEASWPTAARAIADDPSFSLLQEMVAEDREWSGPLWIQCPSVHYVHEALRQTLATNASLLFLRVTAAELWCNTEDNDAYAYLCRLAQTVRALQPCFLVIDDFDLLVSRHPHSGVAGALERVREQVTHRLILVHAGTETPQHPVVEALLADGGRRMQLAPPFTSVEQALALADALDTDKEGDVWPPPDRELLRQQWRWWTAADLLLRRRPTMDTKAPAPAPDPSPDADDSLVYDPPEPAATTLHRLVQSLSVPYDALRKSPLGCPVGALLYGPPGCGKTALMRHLQRQHPRPSFTVLGAPDLARGLVGASERRLHTAITQALQQRTPTVIFIDEADALFPGRQVSGSGLARLAGVLLEQLDALRQASRRGSRVLLVLATNRPWQLDEALLFGDKLDEAVYLPLPDAAARRRLLHRLQESVTKEEEEEEEEMVRASAGLSYADLAGWARRAALDGTRVSSEQLQTAWRSVSDPEVRQFARFQRQMQQRRHRLQFPSD